MGGERRTGRRNQEDAVQRSTRHHPQQTGVTRTSARATLSPYVLDDIAMTRREFESARGSDVQVIVPR
jgi:hypothetical protein